MSELNELKVALVHDELTRRGGAEVVLEEMIRLMPQADIYSLYAGKPRITVDGTSHDVQTTFLQRFPSWFRRHPSRLVPFLSYAAEQIDLADYDMVISSSSGFAKAVVTRANIPHISYCHTPTRYLWESPGVLRERYGRFRSAALSYVSHRLRLSDFTAAQRVDTFIANSNWTKERINTYYRRDANVIYPPVNTMFFTPPPRAEPRQGFFLCVGRLTDSKQFNQAIAVCEKLELPLMIVGKGHLRQYLQSLSNGRTTFLGSVDAAKLRQLYRTARALLQPGVEDFGIATAEATASGCPVIALGKGGAQEIVRHGETGVLYKTEGTEGLAEGIRQFVTMEKDLRHEHPQQHALRFSTTRFRTDFTAAVQRALDNTA